ncbi:unnamed protein product [Ilex paraguariensis]|uniref:Uncharacterized protein n=1 Tax=Ilex paraguariensis TaxID=185542 RepID=A0ABC8S6M9_9AQUA
MKKVTWQWLPFTNSTRKDNIHLYHSVINGIPQMGDYLFASTIRYSFISIYFTLETFSPLNNILYSNI